MHTPLKPLVRAVSLAVATLAASGAVHAGNHFIGLTNVTNNANNVGNCANNIPTTVLADKAIAVINGTSGVVTTDPLTLSGLCRQGKDASNANRNTRNFTGTLTVVQRQVRTCKQWTTKDGVVFGFLNQGLTNVGVTGTLASVVNGMGAGAEDYDVQFAFSAVANNFTCSAGTQGVHDYTATRTATVRRTAKDAQTLATATYTFGNTAPQGNVPEPGTLSLIGLGLAGLGLVAMRRGRKSAAGRVGLDQSFDLPSKAGRRWPPGA